MCECSLTEYNFPHMLFYKKWRSDVKTHFEDKNTKKNTHILRIMTDYEWNVAAKEKGFFKAKIQLSKKSSKNLKKSRKPPNLRSEVLINVGLIKSCETGVVVIERGSRLATTMLKPFARAAVRNHADHDQFFCVLDDYVLCYTVQRRLYCLHQVKTRNAQSSFIKKN